MICLILMAALAFGITAPLDCSFAGELSSSPRTTGRRSTAQRDSTLRVTEERTPADSPTPGEPSADIADPFEPINRLFFQVNDRFYFWLLKPVASGYRAMVPEPFRVGVRNFFSNVATPIRLANCLLQFDVKGAGTEATRFVLNTTIGIAGFLDPARKSFGIEEAEEDFGQTLGFYGIGPIFYINWPILGPSSLRDTAGFLADGFLDPWNYAVGSAEVNLAVKGYNQVNRTSLTIGTYEDLKKAALDPYVAVRDAYHQYRQGKIKD